MGQIVALLQSTQAGQAALATAQDHHVPVIHGTPGGGTYYDPHTNTVYLDPNSTYPADLAIVHEMIHAEYENTGRAADVMALPLNQYLRRMFAEEAAARLAEINHYLERGPLDTDGPNTERRMGFDLYRDAYGPAYQQALQETHNEADAERAGHAAGRLAIVDAILDGTFVMSASGNRQTVRQFYTNQWNEAHGQGGAGAAASPPAHPY